MVLFDRHHTIFQHSDCLTPFDSQIRERKSKVGQKIDGRIEEVKNELKPRVSSQVHTIGLEVGSGEAGQDVKVRGLVGGEHL